MKRLFALAITTALVAPLAGCIVHTHGRGGTRSAAREPACHPSQHWDGHQCRHNGRGHGARKHDGRR